METTFACLQRHGHLLTALLKQAERAFDDGDRARARELIVRFGERLEQRIDLVEGSVFPWIARRVQDSEWLPICCLREQHSALREGVKRVGDALYRRPTTAATALQTLKTRLRTHLEEEDRVVGPLVFVETGILFPHELRARGG